MMACGGVWSSLEDGESAGVQKEIPIRTGFDLALEAEDIIAETRSALTDLFGGTDPNRLIFTHNVTDALNLLINSVLEAGDHVVTTRLEHNSVLRPLYHHGARGVEVDFVPFDASGFVDPEAIVSKIRPDTKLVIMNHGSNVLGTVQDVAAVGAACRQRGVLFAVDAALGALAEITRYALSAVRA
jgi:selenocysteine lyase/cysteine desulfurase